MSKSLGNLVFVGELVKSHDPAAVRLAILSQHYRTSWEWTGKLLTDGEERIVRWRAAGHGEGAIDAVRERLDDDLDTAGAIAAIDEAVAAGLGVSHSAALLGVF
jgi:L-cysteine:1D-myo-inositol 2-amino-2-deoxy-alpha-D-glucopyranoside ligase